MALQLKPLPGPSVSRCFACRPQDGYKDSSSQISAHSQWKAMCKLLRVRVFALGFMAAVTCGWSAERTADQAGSKTVVGQANTSLADGAAALEAGRVEEGLRLTLEGLKVAVTAQENAAGHSNACAGYVLLKLWTEALAQCNAALEFDTSNWRIYNNRAAIYVEKGLFELAMRDLEAGLALAPGAPTLRESLRILERNKGLVGRHAKKTVPS
jgi:tetratricopeptide (TPR) repeat protein